MAFAQGALGVMQMLALGTWFVVFIILGIAVFAYAIYYLIFRLGKEP